MRKRRRNPLKRKTAVLAFDDEGNVIAVILSKNGFKRFKEEMIEYFGEGDNQAGRSEFKENIHFTKADVWE